MDWPENRSVHVALICVIVFVLVGKATENIATPSCAFRQSIVNIQYDQTH